MKFFECKKCGKVLAVANDEIDLTNVEGFVEIKPNTTEAAKEKHIPVVTRIGNLVRVSVGEVTHPMLDNHYIGWVILQTKFGNQRRELHPGQEPVVEFALVDGDEVTNAISYCNLHGLWAIK